MKPVSVAAFNSRDEAEPLRERLAAAGIAAEIRDEVRLDAALGFSRPSAGVRIEVPREDFEAALQLVYGWNTGQDATSRPTPLEWMVPETQSDGASLPLETREDPRSAR